MTLKRKRTASSAVFALSALAATMVMMPNMASAHGYMVKPQDRAYSCDQGSTPNDNHICNSKVAEQKNEINQGAANGDHKAVIKDHQLCSASKGGQYSVLDVPSAKRHVTELVPDQDGYVEFEYHMTAPHKTWYFDLFVTRDGFNPDTDELTWADLERVAVLDESGKMPPHVGGTYKYKVKWPDNKRGKRLVYQVWQRTNPSHKPHEVLGKPPQNVWDSGEAFYSCMDVFVDGGGYKPDPEPGDQWVHQERFAGDKGDLKVGDTAIARIMYEGTTRYEPSVKIDSHNTSEDVWKLELAEEINRNATASEYMEVGVKESNGDIELTHDVNRNNIYFVSEKFSHLTQVVGGEQEEFTFSWPSLQASYTLAGKPIEIPIDLRIDEGDNGEYTYKATLSSMTNNSGQPDIVTGVVGEKPHKFFLVDDEDNYSVSVEVTDSYDNTELDTYNFSVEQGNSEVPNNVDYVYPQGLANYTKGTVVDFGKEGIWQCFGPWYSNCSNSVFAPGQAADPAWVTQQWEQVSK
ncbi:MULTISPECIES: lytic polysaccharide monooxygenase [Vibrio]|uniref:lytic polysaccharide monooxygenase n=1 Tax=Vibrio TaxID=662 RepID=UPI00056FE19F|nr:lytic polysaccharide monooxygenase [Vibrio pacinii]